MKMIGWFIGAGIIVLIAFIVPAYAVSDGGFTLNVIHNEQPIREVENQVAIPFDNEYEILLKNNHYRRCVAEITIDGTPVSNLGNFIISAFGELNLERFVTEFLYEGKKFKFVPLDNPDVQDPSNKDNGVVRVKFRLEKKIEYYIIPDEDWEYWDFDTEDNIDWNIHGVRIYNYGNIIFTNDSNMRVSTILCSASVDSGATIPGSVSDQKFRHIDFESEDEFVELVLKIVGIRFEE